MNGSTWKVACLLLGSGFCALVYQIAWTRELRLIFGGTTAAVAAVLAIFMGGLGLGSALLGRRVDRHPNPLAYYALLELGITVTAAASPFLLWLVRSVYLVSGGSLVTGTLVATIMRLISATVVLGLPTFLMGGTLPAAVRAVESKQDVARHRLAWLYAANTIGAVFGAVLATFVLFELLGTRNTLLSACTINLLVVMIARVLARKWTYASELLQGTPTDQPFGDSQQSKAKVRFVLVSAGIVGFVYFLMEMVWYRMLAPILGGSTYTVGLILATALLGIGIGGLLYAIAGSRKSATLWAFGITCAIEALFIAIPFALGDRIAILALLLRNLGTISFYGYVLGWAIVCGIVIFPASVVAGYQFPLLIALLGQGESHVGAHTGYAYACNTFGAILGSLAGGFGMITLLTATGTWQATVVLLVLISIAAAAMSFREQRSFKRLAAPAVILIASLVMLTATGPTAVWRHGQIGVGAARAASSFESYNNMIDWVHHVRRRTIWEYDGRMASVALVNDGGLGFFVNGKADGFTNTDAATQVASGLVGSMLHPDPKLAMVIGLGTGCSAGWLAEVPSIERVDAVEIESAIVEVARRCAPVNVDVVNHPKVNIILADARELVQTTPERYDVIFSEPSNPYRAGIASLYTQEFYQQVTQRLTDDGVFVQWLQAYQVDAQTIQTIYKTLGSVFPHVETWEGLVDDLLLVCSNTPIQHDPNLIRQRVETYPYDFAMKTAWRTSGIEGWYSHFVANELLSRQIGSTYGSRLNTDDRTLIEYGFARQVGAGSRFSVNEVRELAINQNMHVPETMRNAVDWNRVAELRLWPRLLLGRPVLSTSYAQEHPEIANAVAFFRDGRFSDAIQSRGEITVSSPTPDELVLIALRGSSTDPQAAQQAIETLRSSHPSEADAVAAIVYRLQNKPQQAVAALVSAFTRARTDPWFSRPVCTVALSIASELAAQNPTFAEALFDSLDEPFSVFNLDRLRQSNRMAISDLLSTDEQLRTILDFEPHYLWNDRMLRRRLLIYRKVLHPERVRASDELEEFLANEPARLSNMQP